MNISSFTRPLDYQNEQPTKRRKTEDVGEAFDEILTIVDLSGKDIRSNQTIARLNQLIDVILKNDQRPSMLKKGLKSILLRLEDVAENESSLIHKIREVLGKNSSLKKVCKSFDFEGDKIKALALLQSGEFRMELSVSAPSKKENKSSLDFSQAFFYSLDFSSPGLTPVVGSLPSSDYVIKVSEKLAAQLDDSILEVMLKYADPSTLEKVQRFQFELEHYPLLGNKAPELLLKYCPNIKLSVFANLPKRLCNHKIVIEKQSVDVNKDVLIRFIEYFRTMWNSKLKEGTAQSTETQFNEVDFNLFRGCLEFIGADVDEWITNHEDLFNHQFIEKLILMFDQFRMLDNEEIRKNAKLLMIKFLSKFDRHIYSSDDCVKILNHFYQFESYIQKGYEADFSLALKNIVKYRFRLLEEENLDSYKERVELYELQIKFEKGQERSTYSKLGGLFFTNNEFSKAIEYYKKAISLINLNHLLANDIIDLKRLYAILISVYEAIEDHEESDKWRKTLKEFEKTCGPYDEMPSIQGSFFEFDDGSFEKLSSGVFSFEDQ